MNHRSRRLKPGLQNRDECSPDFTSLGRLPESQSPSLAGIGLLRLISEIIDRATTSETDERVRMVPVLRMGVLRNLSVTSWLPASSGITMSPSSSLVSICDVFPSIVAVQPGK